MPQAALNLCFLSLYALVFATPQDKARALVPQQVHCRPAHTLPRSPSLSPPPAPPTCRRAARHRSVRPAVAPKDI